MIILFNPPLVIMIFCLLIVLTIKFKILNHEFSRINVRNFSIFILSRKIVHLSIVIFQLISFNFVYSFDKLIGILIFIHIINAYFINPFNKLISILILIKKTILTNLINLCFLILFIID